MRRTVGIGGLGVAIAFVSLAPASAELDAEPRSMACTWGGTPADTTGTLEIKPGLTVTPSTEPHKFVATGVLAGGDGCEGKMTFDGTIHAGATCTHQLFEGKVKGVPGVERFYGPGGALLVYEFLYDKDGNIVGADQAQVLSGIGRGPEASDCNTPEGFTEGVFSSLVEIWG
jgi:hypothetical protein